MNGSYQQYINTTCTSPPPSIWVTSNQFVTLLQIYRASHEIAFPSMETDNRKDTHIFLVIHEFPWHIPKHAPQLSRPPPALRKNIILIVDPSCAFLKALLPYFILYVNLIFPPSSLERVILVNAASSRSTQSLVPKLAMPDRKRRILQGWNLTVGTDMCKGSNRSTFATYT